MKQNVIINNMYSQTDPLLASYLLRGAEKSSLKITPDYSYN